MAEQASPRYIPAIAATWRPRRSFRNSHEQSGTMSSIGSPDPNLNRAGLESLTGQVSLDELRRRDQGTGPRGPEQLRGPEPSQPARDVPATDPGEAVLNAAAWDGVPEGQRRLAGDLGFESRLGAMDLSPAADSAADAILSAIG